MVPALARGHAHANAALSISEEKSHASCQLEQRESKSDARSVTSIVQSHASCAGTLPPPSADDVLERATGLAKLRKTNAPSTGDGGEAAKKSPPAPALAASPVAAADWPPRATCLYLWCSAGVRRPKPSHVEAAVGSCGCATPPPEKEALEAQVKQACSGHCSPQLPPTTALRTFRSSSPWAA